MASHLHAVSGGETPRKDYSTGWLDGCAYGERWASSKFFAMGLIAGVIAAIVIVLTVMLIFGLPGGSP